MGSQVCPFTLSGETLNRGHMAIFEDRLLTMTYSGDLVDYGVPNV